MLQANIVTSGMSAKIGVHGGLYADMGHNDGLCADMGAKIVSTSGYEDYDGEYTVTPTMEEQRLDTEKRTTKKDVVIKPIPYYEVSNDKGTTIIIGG